MGAWINNTINCIHCKNNFSCNNVNVTKNVKRSILNPFKTCECIKAFDIFKTCKFQELYIKPPNIPPQAQKSKTSVTIN